MPVRGSGLAVAAARITLSPTLTTAEPPACLANFPVSKESCFPPASSTEIFVASGFIDHSFVWPLGGLFAASVWPWYGQKAYARVRSSRRQADARRRLGPHFAKASRGLEPAPTGADCAVICGCRAWK